MKLSKETMQNIIQADLNAMSGQTEYIAGMTCHRLKDGTPLQLGDIVYAYYSQTDGFTVYDVVQLTETHAVMQEIDADCLFDENEVKLSNTLLIAGPARFDTFYRPKPEDRKLVEAEGFSSAAFSRFGGNREQSRKLAIKIYEDPKKEDEGKGSFITKMVTLAMIAILLNIVSLVILNKISI